MSRKFATKKVNELKFNLQVSTNFFLPVFSLIMIMFQLKDKFVQLEKHLIVRKNIWNLVEFLKFVFDQINTFTIELDHPIYLMIIKKRRRLKSIELNEEDSNHNRKQSLTSSRIINFMLLQNQNGFPKEIKFN